MRFDFEIGNVRIVGDWISLAVSLFFVALLVNHALKIKTRRQAIIFAISVFLGAGTVYLLRYS